MGRLDGQHRLRLGLDPDVEKAAAIEHLVPVAVDDDVDSADPENRGRPQVDRPPRIGPSIRKGPSAARTTPDTFGPRSAPRPCRRHVRRRRPRGRRPPPRRWSRSNPPRSSSGERLRNRRRPDCRRVGDDHRGAGCRSAGRRNGLGDGYRACGVGARSSIRARAAASAGASASAGRRSVRCHGSPPTETRLDRGGKQPGVLGQAARQASWSSGPAPWSARGRRRQAHHRACTSPFNVPQLWGRNLFGPDTCDSELRRRRERGHDRSRVQIGLTPIVTLVLQQQSSSSSSSLMLQAASRGLRPRWPRGSRPRTHRRPHGRPFRTASHWSQSGG